MTERLIDAVSRFFRETIWVERAGAKSLWRFFTRLMQVVFMVVRDFEKDRGFLSASALAYTTLLSLVPLMAFGFSVLKGLGAENQMREYFFGSPAVVATGDVEPGREAGDEENRQGIIHRITGGQSEVAERLVAYVEKTDFTALGIFGLVFLLWTVVKVLSTVENTFNYIWGVPRPRTWLRKLSDYTSVMVIAPVLLVTAIGVATYFLRNPLKVPGVPATFWEYFTRAAGWAGPVVLTWLSFAAFYVFMPNRKVPVKAAFTGGIVGGTLWQAFFWGYTGLNIGVATYNPLYGSFAALPIFLVWLYISWLVVILGAEVAYAQEHVETYRMSLQRVDLSARAKELLALSVFFEIARSFRGTKGAPGVDDLVDALDIGTQPVREVLDDLESAGLVSEVEEARTAVYKPGRDLAGVTPGDVLRAVRDTGDSFSPKEGDALCAEASRLHSNLEAAFQGGDLDANISEMLDRT